MLQRRFVETALPCLYAALLACGSSKGQDPASGGGSGGSSPTGSAGVGNGGASGCGPSVASGGGCVGPGPSRAGIELRLAAPVAASGGGQSLLAFAGGGAVRPGIESLEYHIFSVQICESMQTSGSGFSNPTGCLELYTGDTSQLAYEPDSDWTPLADAARQLDAGFVNLLDASSRAALQGTTELGDEHVRSYNYGIITWSLPIKVKATIPLGDGSWLYTHDGTTERESLGSDGFLHYFTQASRSLAAGPAEKAVVLLGNGGNWFKFQNPLTVTSADIAERRQWVLDLVFNPEGIVKGFAGDGIGAASLEERDAQGARLRAVTVPMLDLAPIPHRQSEQVLRESYLASVRVGAHAFDLRLELYSVDGDPNGTIYGVDLKTLVTAESTAMPPEVMKVSYVVGGEDGRLSFESFAHGSLISGFARVTEPFGTTEAQLSCATHADRAGAEGGAALVLDSCPAPTLDVTFRLLGRSRLDGELPSAPPAGDAGAGDAGPTGDAGDAGGAADAGADAAP